jgi:hypothetical protein
MPAPLGGEFRILSSKYFVMVFFLFFAESRTLSGFTGTSCHQVVTYKGCLLFWELRATIILQPLNLARIRPWSGSQQRS